MELYSRFCLSAIYGDAKINLEKPLKKKRKYVIIKCTVIKQEKPKPARMRIRRGNTDIFIIKRK